MPELRNDNRTRMSTVDVFIRKNASLFCSKLDFKRDSRHTDDTL